ncbi:MAG: endonuclease/exonuclease/phosphatase family protein [Nitrospirota bacterium]
MRPETISVLTYNVHGCAGLDNEISPSRIAEVVAQYSPDVVALQELDTGRRRSGLVNQPEVIAGHLNMGGPARAEGSADTSDALPHGKGGALKKPALKWASLLLLLALAGLTLWLMLK